MATLNFITPPSGPQMLTQSNFVYRGYYDIPLAASDNSCGLTVHSSSGNLIFGVLELHDPLSGLDPTYHQYTTSGKTYGDVLGSPIFSGDMEGGQSVFDQRPGLSAWQGIWWDKDNERLYANSGSDYDAAVDSKMVVYQKSGSSFASYHGPVGLEGINNKRCDGGFFALPTLFQTTYDTAPLVTGLGGYRSTYSNGASICPVMFCTPMDLTSYTVDTDIPYADYQVLLAKDLTTYSRAVRGQKPWLGYTFTLVGTKEILAGNTVETAVPVEVQYGTIEGPSSGDIVDGGALDYTEGGDPRPNGTQTEPDFLPLTAYSIPGWGEYPSSSGRQAWNFFDNSIGGFMIYSAAWKGCVIISRNTYGKDWYEGGAFHTDSFKTCLNIYDPDQLGAVRNGLITSNSVNPASLGFLTEAPCYVGAAAYDPVLSFCGVKVGNVDGTSRVHVYEVVLS